MPSLLCVAEQALSQWLILVLLAGQWYSKQTKTHTKLSSVLAWCFSGCAGMQAGLANRISAKQRNEKHTHWQTLTLWKACPQFTVNFSQHLDVMFSRHFHQTLHRCGEKGEKGRLGLMEWIFFSCFPRRWLWLTEPRSYFMCLTPNCISGPGRYRSVCLSLNKIRRYYPAQYCSLFSALSLNTMAITESYEYY